MAIPFPGGMLLISVAYEDSVKNARFLTSWGLSTAAFYSPVTQLVASNNTDAPNKYRYQETEVSTHTGITQGILT